MHIITTHKGTDFDALASVAAANLLYPDAVTVLPSSLNANVNAFLSLHKDLFRFCTMEKIDPLAVTKLTIVDANRWDRLDRLDILKEKPDLDIALFDHHGNTGNIAAGWQCQEEMGANITLMLRYLREKKILITPIHATLFLTGLYEDTGNLTFPLTKAEDVYAAGYLLENGADLHISGAFLSPIQGPKQKDVLSRMLGNTTKTTICGYKVNLSRIEVHGQAGGLSVVMQMYRQITNADAAFGIFELDGNRCLVIGRSFVDGINISIIMRYLGGGGNPGAGSAILKAADPRAVEAWIPTIIKEIHQPSTRIRDLMSSPVLTLTPAMTMAQARDVLREKGYKGAPVVDDGKLAGVLSIRDFKKLRKKQQLHLPVKAFMSTDIISIHPDEGPEQAIQLMIKHDLGRLPVLDDNEIVGIFSRSDAVSDLYGLCPLGDSLASGCEKSPFTTDLF